MINTASNNPVSAPAPKTSVAPNHAAEIVTCSGSPEFFYQVLTVLMFAVFLALTMYFLSEKDQGKMLLFGFLAWTSVGAAFAVFLNSKVLVEPQLTGTLRPSSEPSPILPRPLPENALAVNFGSVIAYTTNRSAVLLQISQENVLSINRSDDGIEISARIRSADGKLIAEIEHNDFTINPNNYFKKRRPNKSVLIIFDQAGAEVLNVRFANRQYMVVTGRFARPVGPPVVATTESLQLAPRQIMRGGMLGNQTEAMIRVR